MKILTVCQGGACRSVSLARVLKDVGGHDALAASWRYNSKDTLSMLCQWADIIVLLQPGGRKYLSSAFWDKIRVCDVGPDRWGSAINPELTGLCQQWATDEGLLPAGVPAA